MRLFLFLSLLICSCQINPSETSNEVEVDPMPVENPQWVFYKGQNPAKNKHIVLISGDEEYRSEEALPQLAKILSQHHGFDCTVLFAQDPAHPGLINPNHRHHIPGLERLETADLMILFTRFRSLPSEEMEYIENYLQKGKPLIGIRTATHAFNYEDPQHPFYHYTYTYQGEKLGWDLGFGKKILGETWSSQTSEHKRYHCCRCRKPPNLKWN